MTKGTTFYPPRVDKGADAHVAIPIQSQCDLLADQAWCVAAAKRQDTYIRSHGVGLEDATRRKLSSLEIVSLIDDADLMGRVRHPYAVQLNVRGERIRRRRCGLYAPERVLSGVTADERHARLDCNLSHAKADNPV